MYVLFCRFHGHIVFPNESRVSLACNGEKRWSWWVKPFPTWQLYLIRCKRSTSLVVSLVSCCALNVACSPEDASGKEWEIKDETLVLKWMEKNPFPGKILRFVTCSCQLFVILCGQTKVHGFMLLGKMWKHGRWSW